MRPRHRPLPLAASLLLILGACAAGQAGGSSRSVDLITREEFADGSLANAHDVISRLRPTWLRPRPATSFSQSNELVVYVDNVRSGGVDRLQSLPAGSIETLERIDGPTATQRWGTGHAGGVIMVNTRRGP